MRYMAIACDYDGTLATHGVVEEPVIQALKAVSASGRKLIIVTGRELDDLMRVFPEYHIFDRIVAENGAVLYCPSSKKERVLAEPPSDELITVLQTRHVEPIRIGQSIIATWEPYEVVVMEAIHTLGLELQVIFNKGAVMILPSGVNKGTGFLAALSDLKLSRHNTVGFGDAENDHAFLSLCEFSVAVDNALPSIKLRADYVSSADHGKGVVEVLEQMLEDDLSRQSPKRNLISFGKQADKEDVKFDPFSAQILIAGISGGGKSRTTRGILESLTQQGYQFCVIDPEGDYEAFDSAIVLGNSERPPTTEEALQVLDDPYKSIIVNLLGVSLEDRPAVFEEFLTELLYLRRSRGRPHILVLDEAHHLLPSEWRKTKELIPPELGSLLMITVHPGRINPNLLAGVNILITIGDGVDKIVEEFARQARRNVPLIPWRDLEKSQGVVWLVDSDDPPQLVDLMRSDADRRRHRRKYAQGKLPEHCSFYFKGPDNRLNLRVQNLNLFNQIADGLDDETWLFHLLNGDISKWFKEVIKDDELHKVAREAESNRNLTARESRAVIRQAIEDRYTSAA